MAEKDTGFWKNGISGGKLSFRIRFSLDHTLSVSFTWILVLISIPYLLWEVYWARHAGYAFIKWHTHLALYYYLWLASYLLLHASYHIFRWRYYIKYQTIAASLFVTFFIVECILVAAGIGDTYMEKIKYGYASRYDARYETFYRLHKPDETFYISRPEFNYVRHCNSLGYSDTEWPKAKRPHQKRYLCTGDSFTEGVGASEDSSYVSLLRSLLHDRDTESYVMNAGIAGDDPCINFVDYRDGLEDYKPDYIIQTLSSNDMNTDIATKGGMERFRPDHTVHFRPAPWWESIYALSYISRLFFSAMGYNEMLIRGNFCKSDKQSLDQKAKDVFAAYEKELAKQGAILLVILQPTQGEIYQKGFEYDFSEIASYLHTLPHVKVYNLIPYYRHYFATGRDDIRDYYWRQDGHHNGRGYYLMAKSVEAAVDSFGLK